MAQALRITLTALSWWCADSVEPTSVLGCGHTLHEHCLTTMTENNQTSCPVCMKSFGDMHLVRTPVWAPQGVAQALHLVWEETTAPPGFAMLPVIWYPKP